MNFREALLGRGLGALLVCAFGLASLAAQAGEMYRWVDERGVTNLSDTIPEKYRDKAIRVDAKPAAHIETPRAEPAARIATPASRAAAPMPAEPAQLLDEQLGALSAERPGTIDVYAITYAPYADEDVFRRESAMVANVMQQRFGAQGRTVQLVNHRDTVAQFPRATVSNLQKTIRKMAALMNRDEDILFIHLTSHGGSDGVLSTHFGPVPLEPVTPVKLKAWLDAAQVRYRVISISACFSGSWIAPLAGDGTLVMTAADADHTSYGCGRASELTYFGRAMFDEQLRHTRSFEDAHAAARKTIDQRERAAGKSDGYSNPQIRIGAAIRERLKRLAAERANAAAH